MCETTTSESRSTCTSGPSVETTASGARSRTRCRTTATDGGTRPLPLFVRGRIDTSSTARLVACTDGRLRRSPLLDILLMLLLIVFAPVAIVLSVVLMLLPWRWER